MSFRGAHFTYFCVYFENYHTTFLINMYFQSPLIILNPAICDNYMIRSLVWETALGLCLVTSIFTFFVTHFRFGENLFLSDGKLPGMIFEYIYRENNLLSLKTWLLQARIIIYVLYPNLTFDLKYFENYLLRFIEILFFLFIFSS